MQSLRERIHNALKNLNILKGDLDHVERCLLRTEPSEHKRLARGYCAAWVWAYEAEQNTIFKQNAARRAANLWIDKATEEEKNGR